ncbi:HAD domain-containing protein [Cupriavidus sp. IK-TO18]|uniref:HAD domain-containing protein n=1 Tax=Cupriavidus sp. IK-TO18 TaxID=2782182 RepID=UPI0034CE905C
MPCTLYLGFEGVLHPNQVFFSTGGLPKLKAPGHKLFENNHFLEQILEAVPDTPIVIHSWWVYYVGYRAARERLPAVAQRQVIGATWPRNRVTRFKSKEPTPRSDWLIQDLARRRPQSVAIVDYDYRLVPTQLKDVAFILHGTQGLCSQEQCDALITLLREAPACSPLVPLGRKGTPASASNT